MALQDDDKGDGDLPKPAKRQRKVSFSADTATDPNSCITIRLVSSAEEMQTDPTVAPEFSPDFAERFFGDEGKIFGYKKLTIVVWLHALSFQAYVEITDTETIPDAKAGKGHVTDLKKIFQEIFGEGLIEDRDAFLQLLTSDNISDVIHRHGRRVAAWKLPDSQESCQNGIEVNSDTSEVSKEILRLEDLTAQELRGWHARLTPLALMFIEAATSIEIKDPRWEVYLCLEKTLHGSSLPWRIVGFCRVYKFFKYPDSTRLRVSQILVLPPYQGKQNGLHLLEAVYKTAVEQGSYEVTMEEPSNDLQVLRECMDAVRLVAFDPVRSELQEALSKLRASSKANSSVNFQALMPSSALVEKVRQNFKICRLQLQYCWQIMMYLHVMDEGENILSLFRNLIASSLKLEVFGNSKSSNVGKNKLLIDVENEYDSSRTFVMFKVKPSSVENTTVLEVEAGVSTGLGQDHLKEALDMDPEANAENAYQDLVKEREEEIHEVAEKVAQRLKVVGMPLVQSEKSGMAGGNQATA